MQNGVEFSSLEFITAGGPVSILVAVILLVMSVISWYLIVTKSLQAWRVRSAYESYAQTFWSAPNLNVAIKQQSNVALAHLAQQSILAAEHYQAHVIKGKVELNAEMNTGINKDEFIARAMNRSMTQESAKLEAGLTALASIGSVSPFVGLFGTVWGIYHALATISQTGQATLDKVAGPVGEALIMTALGLAVAIPAVLAYNALLRNNRNQLAKLERFAYELHTLLITGAVMHTQPAPIKARSTSKDAIHAVEVPA